MSGHRRSGRCDSAVVWCGQRTAYAPYAALTRPRIDASPGARARSTTTRVRAHGRLCAWLRCVQATQGATGRRPRGTSRNAIAASNLRTVHPRECSAGRHGPINAMRRKQTQIRPVHGRRERVVAGPGAGVPRLRARTRRTDLSRPSASVALPGPVRHRRGR